jgi:hypothetical protein
MRFSYWLKPWVFKGTSLIATIALALTILSLTKMSLEIRLLFIIAGQLPCIIALVWRPGSSFDGAVLGFALGASASLALFSVLGVFAGALGGGKSEGMKLLAGLGLAEVSVFIASATFLINWLIRALTTDADSRMPAFLMSIPAGIFGFSYFFLLIGVYIH